MFSKKNIVKIFLFIIFLFFSILLIVLFFLQENKISKFLCLVFFIFFMFCLIKIIYAFFKKYLKNKKIKQNTKQNIEKGIFGENYVIDKLINELEKEKIEFNLINDLYLPNDFNKIDYVSQIDHILLTRKFLYIIETKWHDLDNSIVYGNAENKFLIILNLKTKTKNNYYNPGYQNKTHIQNYKNLLIKWNKDNSYIIPFKNIKNIVILKNKEKIRITNAGNNSQIFYYNIDNFIEKIINFEKNNNVKTISKIQFDTICLFHKELLRNKNIYKENHKFNLKY